MCSLRDAAPRFADLDARVLAVSLDDVHAQKAFATSQGLAYPLLSDPDGSVARKYGVLASGGRYALRVTFLVDPGGVLRHVDREVDVTTHGADLAAVLAGLRRSADPTSPPERGGAAVIPLELALENPPATGLVVTRIVEGSQAAGSGLALGDVIVAYGGMETPTLDAMREAKTRAASAGKPAVEVAAVRPDGTRLILELEPGSIGVLLSAVEKGEGAEPLPPVTPIAFDWSALAADPHDDWYEFWLTAKERRGFAHAIAKVTDDRVTMRREVAFDGGEQWGLNHFDVSVEMNREAMPRLLSVRFENPVTGYVGEGAVASRQDGTRVLRYTRRQGGGAEPASVETVLPTDLPSIPGYFVETLACVMPREAGACFHYRSVVDGYGTLDPRTALFCVGEEEIDSRDGKVKAFRYELRSLGGATGAAYWVDATGHIVESHYGGPVVMRTTKTAALKGLHESLRPRTAGPEPR